MISFADISNNPSSWYVVTDQVMGGKSELEAGYDDGVFSLNGYVTTVNNGGFVRLAHRPKNIDKDVKGILSCRGISSGLFSKKSKWLLSHPRNGH